MNDSVEPLELYRGVYMVLDVLGYVPAASCVFRGLEPRSVEPWLTDLQVVTTRHHARVILQVHLAR